jgi:hypothetical protein
MGGELDVESEVGVGSAFLLRLPSLGAAAAAPPRVTRRTASPKPETTGR